MKHVPGIPDGLRLDQLTVGQLVTLVNHLAGALMAADERCTNLQSTNDALTGDLAAASTRRETELSAIRANVTVYRARIERLAKQQQILTKTLRDLVAAVEIMGRDSIPDRFLAMILNRLMQAKEILAVIDQAEAK